MPIARSGGERSAPSPLPAAEPWYSHFTARPPDVPGVTDTPLHKEVEAAYFHYQDVVTEAWYTADPSHLDTLIANVKRIDSVYDAYRVLPGARGG